MDSLGDPRQWKQEAHDFFQSQAELYANEREHQQGFRAQLAIVMRALAQERGKVLDIGCATGSIIQALRARDFEVVGIDFSSQMLAFARQRFGENLGVRLCRADVEFLPFSAESFDDVTCLGILEYLPDYHRAVAEIARVLRPGGLAIFSIPSRISPYHLGDCLAEAVAGPPLRFMKHLLGRVATWRRGGSTTGISAFHGNSEGSCERVALSQSRAPIRIFSCFRWIASGQTPMCAWRRFWNGLGILGRWAGRRPNTWSPRGSAPCEDPWVTVRRLGPLPDGASPAKGLI